MIVRIEGPTEKTVKDAYGTYTVMTYSISAGKYGTFFQIDKDYIEDVEDASLRKRLLVTEVMAFVTSLLEQMYRKESPETVRDAARALTKQLSRKFGEDATAYALQTMCFINSAMLK